MSKGQIVDIDWNRIAPLHSHVLAHMNSLTASRCHIKASHLNSLPASRRHITRHIEMLPINVSPRIYIISCCCYFSVNIFNLRLRISRVDFIQFVYIVSEISQTEYVKGLQNSTKEI